MSIKFAAGDLTIHRVIEQETSFLPALEMLPDLTGERLAENRSWLKQAKALDDDDTLILCFQSYIVRTPHHTILIDTCIGRLKAAGFSVEDIDFVMCTHLHPDHVGWNTRLQNGRWVPTFPNARYVFGKTEFEHW